MEKEKETLELNTLRINLEGDGSAIKHIWKFHKTPGMQIQSYSLDH